MDPLVFDPHEECPEGIVPVDGHRQRRRADGLIDHRPHRVAICLDLRKRWPVVMGVVQIVPRHLVDSDGKHRFEAGVDPPIGELGDDELVDKEGSRMPQVKDQRVPQRFGPQVEGLFLGEGFVKLFVEGVGGVEVAADFLAFFLAATLVKDRRPRTLEVHSSSQCCALRINCRFIIEDRTARGSFESEKLSKAFLCVGDDCAAVL